MIIHSTFVLPTDTENTSGFNMKFHEFKIPAECFLKVYIKGVPIYNNDDKMTNSLTSLNFTVKHVRCFGHSAKPLPIYLTILVQTTGFKQIFKINNLFYLSLRQSISEFSDVLHFKESAMVPKTLDKLRYA